MSTPSYTPSQSQIVKNSAENFSLYYNTLNYFKTIMVNHPSIAKVSQGDIYNFDATEFPQYPIGNVVITNANFGSKTTDYQVQLIVADKVKVMRDDDLVERTNIQKVPFEGTDDVVDIHANTLSILNDLTAYTQKSNYGMEINSDINCTPFVDRFNNGLAGWSAEFTLTVHNDKNRCLFFLIIPDGQYWKIEDCETGERYNAVMQLDKTITQGQVFATNYFPDWRRKTYMESYTNLRCFTVLEEILNRDDYDFWNLPVLAIPFEDFGTCEICDLWISPKIWSTTPERWGVGVDRALRKWQYT
jgi:hypothetical protein